MAPEIFDQTAKDGTTFQCSYAYLWCWQQGRMLWSERRATHAAQKLPNDWEKLYERGFLCMAYSITEEDIPAELHVNSDQMQVMYAQGFNLTWALISSKQVMVIGQDKK